MERIKAMRYNSPIGELIVGSYNGKLCICDWVTGRRRNMTDRHIQQSLNARYESGTSNTIVSAIDQLNEYFSGKRKTFNIPLLFTGTPFQNRVREELLNIPFGTTISYAELAHRIGNEKAVRAVAMANATNPISIFVPCHRVIGSDNKLTGYGGGLEAKQALISLEQGILPFCL